jgi:hypothetical protein
MDTPCLPYTDIIHEEVNEYFLIQKTGREMLKP